MLVWTDRDPELRALWDEGHSAAEIARRMGLATKNMVIGRVRRLALPPRPSPIIRNPLGRSRSDSGRQTAAMISVPPLVVPSDIAAKLGQTVAPGASAPTNAVTGIAARGETVEAGAATPVSAAPKLGKQPCCWPLGEPGTPGFRFCDGLALFGKPYCPAHAAEAFTGKLRDKTVREYVPRLPRPARRQPAGDGWERFGG